MTRSVLLLVAFSTVAGCSGQNSTTGPYVPRGGVDARTARIVLDDVWIDAPQGVPRGGDAGLRLSMVNESDTPDALVGVTTSVAKDAQLRLDGKDVGRIALAPHQGRDLEWGRGSGVELKDFSRALQPGQWIRITLQFDQAAPVTMQITAGPLAPQASS